MLELLLLDLMEMSWSPTEVTRSRTLLLFWSSGHPRRRPSKLTTLWSTPSPTKPASVQTLHAATLTQGLEMDMRQRNQPPKLSKFETEESPTIGHWRFSDPTGYHQSMESKQETYQNLPNSKEEHSPFPQSCGLPSFILPELSLVHHISMNMKSLTCSTASDPS